MKTIYVNTAQEGKRIDRVIREAFAQVPMNAVFKALRKRDIKVNGVRIKEDCCVSAGDRVEVFITDDILEGRQKTSSESASMQGFSIVYEDHNLMIVNKEQGIPVHADRNESSGTLIDNLRQYLIEKGEVPPSESLPALCHRLDRNTGGLVLVAKNVQSLKALQEKMKANEIRKIYQCLVKGAMEKKSATLKAYLLKKEELSRVFLYDAPLKGALEIITKYRVLSCVQDVSRLEVELLTGRTHQIRAHMAHIGHPVLGDGKYGKNAVNKQYPLKHQALWATKLIFNFQSAGHLSYMKGKAFEIEPKFGM